MALEALHPVGRTIDHLLNSASRISIESPSREILESAHDAVRSTIELLKLIQHVESDGNKYVEADVKEAARMLEDVLDSRVSDVFLDGDHGKEPFLLEDVLDSRVSDVFLDGDHGKEPFLLSLDLQQGDIVGFIQKMKKINRVFDPWFEEEDGGKVSDIFELSDGYRITRSRFMNWYATKAASIFLGKKEDYFDGLMHLVPDEQEDDDYALVLTSDFSEYELEYRYSKIKQELTKWWIDKATSFLTIVEEKEEWVREIVNPFPEIEVYSVSPYRGGSTQLSRSIRDELFEDLLEFQGGFRAKNGGIFENPHRFLTASFAGMAGIGKTDVVMKIISDPLFWICFERCIFVRVGPECDFNDVLRAITAKLYPVDFFEKVDIIDQLNPHGDEEIAAILALMRRCGGKTFKNGYVIVLDDVWDSSLVSFLAKSIPSDIRVSMILLTTRIYMVADVAESVRRVQFLDKEESWDLLRKKVFAKETCPHDLEKAGMKIAENCEGLPLLIVTVADLLSEHEKTPKFWSEVAANKTNDIFVGAYERILKVVYPSYNYLPQHFKTCFLYMGAIPQNCEVRISKLINLWSAEGFFDDSFEDLHYSVKKFFEELVSNYHVALDPQQNSIHNNLKACSLHSVFWYLCKKVAWDEKFLHVLNSYRDASKLDIESRRRLSIYKNSILSRKDVHHLIASMSAVRSFLCTGPYHQYQVPISFDLRLLKILDALTIRFFEFPLEVLKLLHLRYLALTSNGNLPSSISKLWKLQCLIVHQHQSIRHRVSQLSYVPVEIWDLQELEYLQIIGRDLPVPPPGVVLTNLLILLDVGARTITKRVIESIPNLEKLRVRIELVPDVVVPLSCFYDDISHLEVLSSLQCVVVNPILMPKVVAPTPLHLNRYLRKLTLSGFGYPWKDIEKIAGLRGLEELKLQCYAFRGEKWEAKRTGWGRLRYLSIEDTDLVQWTSSYNAFPLLRGLSLKNCYSLQEIPNMKCLRDIWLVDCHPSVATCAKQMGLSNVHVDCSWSDK